MSKRVIFLFFLGLLLMKNIYLSTGAQAAEINTYKLPNGLTVAIQQDQRFPLVSMRLYVHAGSAYERPEEAGISHILEHMVFKGTKKRPAGNIAEDIEKIGGYINAATSFDYTVYIVDLPSEHWKIGLDVIRDMVFDPLLDPEQLESEKNVIVSELKRGEDSQGNLLFKQLHTESLGKTPYDHPIIGYEKTIREVTPEAIKNYMDRLYQPQAMLLLVCGNVDEKKLMAEIEALYSPLKNTHDYHTPEQIPFASQDNGMSIDVKYGAWNKAYIGFALPSTASSETRSVHLDVLANLLGGSKTAYFYRKYKYDLRMVDSISISNYSFERIGMLYFTAVLDADKLPEFWNELTKDLAQLNNIRFTQQELERAKLNMEDELYRAKETISGLASKQGYFMFFDNGKQGEENYLYTLRNTSLKDLENQLSDILLRSKLKVAVLVPKESKVDEKGLTATLLKNWPEDTTSKTKTTATIQGKKETIKLGSGQTLILIPDHTMPYISAELMFTGGDSLLQQEKQGLSSLTASMLTKGAGTLGATAFEDYLADRASSLVASSGRQTFSLSIDCPARFTNDLFLLLQDVLKRPTFLQKEFDRVKQNQIAAIKSTEDQPLGLAFRRLFPFLFSGHPYGYLQLGEITQIEQIEVEELKDFWAQQQKQNWVLSVCGTFDRDEIIAIAKKLPIPSANPIKIQEPAWNKEKQLVLHLPERKQAHIILVFPTTAIGTEDAAGVNLLQSILSGQSGLLFTDMRDKQGLGYTVTAIPWNTQKAGALLFYIGTEPDKTEQAKKGFIDVVEMLHNSTLPESELERGKQSIKGEYYRKQQSLGARSAEAATLATLGLPQDMQTQQIEKINKITPAQLQKIAKKYLDLDKAYWMEVLP